MGGTRYSWGTTAATPAISARPNGKYLTCNSHDDDDDDGDDDDDDDDDNSWVHEKGTFVNGTNVGRAYLFRAHDGRWWVGDTQMVYSNHGWCVHHTKQAYLHLLFVVCFLVFVSKKS